MKRRDSPHPLKKWRRKKQTKIGFCDWCFSSRPLSSPAVPYQMLPTSAQSPLSTVSSTSRHQDGFPQPDVGHKIHQDQTWHDHDHPVRGWLCGRSLRVCLGLRIWILSDVGSFLRLRPLSVHPCHKHDPDPGGSLPPHHDRCKWIVPAPKMSILTISSFQHLGYLALWCLGFAIMAIFRLIPPWGLFAVKNWDLSEDVLVQYLFPMGWPMAMLIQVDFSFGIFPCKVSEITVMRFFASRYQYMYQVSHKRHTEVVKRMIDDHG